MGLCKGGPYKLTLVHNHQHSLTYEKCSWNRELNTVCCRKHFKLQCWLMTILSFFYFLYTVLMHIVRSCRFSILVLIGPSPISVFHPNLWNVSSLRGSCVMLKKRGFSSPPVVIPPRPHDGDGHALRPQRHRSCRRPEKHRCSCALGHWTSALRSTRWTTPDLPWSSEQYFWS